MKTSTQTYQQFVKTVTVILLAALFVPSGLHAKQFVDFCTPSSSEHPMAADHSCCDEPDANESSDSHQNHTCDGGIICACNVSLSVLNDIEWVVSNNHFVITLPETAALSLHIPTSEPIHRDQQFRIGHFKPPLWLLYDTYLI